ncbi:MAG: hypothetical protein WCK02_01910 [Bacteroidota bacterium]
MKKLFVILIAIVFTACSSDVDLNIAKTKTSELLTLLQNQQYDKTEAYYADLFNETESIEARTAKYKKIEETSGKIKSFEFLDSTPKNMDERNVLVLRYKVICENLTLTHTFIVGMEEGDCKVLNHEMTNL